MISLDSHSIYTPNGGLETDNFICQSCSHLGIFAMELGHQVKPHKFYFNVPIQLPPKSIVAMQRSKGGRWQQQHKSSEALGRGSSW